MIEKETNTEFGKTRVIAHGYESGCIATDDQFTINGVLYSRSYCHFHLKNDKWEADNHTKPYRWDRKDPSNAAINKFKTISLAIWKTFLKENPNFLKEAQINRLHEKIQNLCSEYEELQTKIAENQHAISSLKQELKLLDP